MTRSPILAAFLSTLIPGLGQLYNGERTKGIAMLCMVGGILITVMLSHSLISVLLLDFVYLAIVIPAARDAYVVASGRATPFAGDRPWYIAWMLLTVGPFALPLLWQSTRLSKRAKVTWTVIVVIIAAGGLLVITVIGPRLEHALQQPLLGY